MGAEQPWRSDQSSTGKTPEYFIKEVGRYLQNWSKKEIKKELEEGGVDAGRRPDMGSLHFVQIDEFYPIHSSQHNSFYNYVKKYYLGGFGFDEKQALLINSDEIRLSGGRHFPEVFPDSRDKTFQPERRLFPKARKARAFPQACPD